MPPIRSRLGFGIAICFVESMSFQKQCIRNSDILGKSLVKDLSKQRKRLLVFPVLVLKK